jgi:putative transposase
VRRPCLLESITNWEKLSIIAGTTKDGRVLQNTHEGAVNGLGVIAFLKHLLAHVEGKIKVVLDGASIHKSKIVKDFVASEDGLEVEYLPGYAPVRPKPARCCFEAKKSTPIEWLWAWAKSGVLSNLCPGSLVELKRGWQAMFGQVRLRPELVGSFFRASAIGRI